MSKKPTSTTVTGSITGDIPVRSSFFQRLRWAFPFLLATLPIVLLTVYTYRTASASLEHMVRRNNLSEATSVSELITQDFTRTVSLAHAIASLEGTIDAVESRDDETLRNRLQAIVYSYAQVERAFVVDRTGKLWSEYPSVEGAYGASFEDAEWYRGVSSAWKPYISGVYHSSLQSRHPVVAIAVPLFDADGNPIGVLGFEYHLRQVSKWLQNSKLSQGGYVYVADHDGALAAHPHIDLDDALHREYVAVPQVLTSLKGDIVEAEYVDAYTQTPMVAAFLPFTVGRNRWVAVAQQPTAEAYAPLHRMRGGIVAAGLTLTGLTFFLIVALARTSARNERLNRQLRAANQTLRDITSVVSHQLKAPITAIRWTLEMLQDGSYGALPEPMRKPIADVADINDKNYHLVSDILNISRIDRGVIEVQLAPTSLRETVELAVRAYRPTFIEKNLALKIDVPSDDIIVMADTQKLSEAIGNSVSNALKHTKEGSITVRTRTGDDENAYIDVIDTGEGMTPEMLEKLFTRDQVTGANANPESSAGLGLYITRNFMRLQHGDVTASAIIGKGSTFTYVIPLAIKDK